MSEILPQRLIFENATEQRSPRQVTLGTDLAIVGGGLAGTCAAIAAAREGMQVVLLQDRPVLGGNASSEVRLWMLGATSHMGNNNRWARESGIIGEILVETSTGIRRETHSWWTLSSWKWWNKSPISGSS